MNNKSGKNISFRKSNLLVGASLFLFLVAYFNIRSDREIDAFDWGVIIFGVLFVIYALKQKFSEKGK